METTQAASVISLRSIGASLALLLGAVAATVGTVYYIFELEKQAKQRLNQAQARQVATRTQLARAHEDEREIREKITRYQDILSQGRTETEHRLDWVEALQHIKESRRLLGLDFEIAPQRLLDEKIPASGGYAFLTSPMKLSMPLLHENDLLGLFADLSRQVHALVSIKSCRVERLPPASGQKATLQARCELEWITLQEKT